MDIKSILLKKISNQENQVNNFLDCKDIQNKEIKTCKVEVRLTEEEKNILMAMAKLNRTNSSELIRHLVFVKYFNDLVKNQ